MSGLSKVSLSLSLQSFLHLSDNLFQICPEIISQILPTQSKFHDSLEVSELISRIIPLSFEIISVDLTIPRQYAKRIRQLDLSPFPGFVSSKMEKISGVITYRPKAAKRLGALATDGFSIISDTFIRSGSISGFPSMIP